MWRKVEEKGILQPFYLDCCVNFVQLRDDFKKKTDYLMTLIKRVGGYLAEITTS